VGFPIKVEKQGSPGERFNPQSEVLKANRIIAVYRTLVPPLAPRPMHTPLFKAAFHLLSQADI
jgi:hypothetical protein